MNMIKKVLCLILLFFAINVKAVDKDTCDKNELRRLKEIASHLSFTYEFKEDKSNFDIIVDNITSEVKPLIIHSWDLLEYDEFVPNSSGTARLTGFISGQRVKITVKAYVNNSCVAKDLLTKTIVLPYINRYLNSEECKKNPEFKYCLDKLTNVNISENTFKSEYAKYIKEKEKGVPTMVINNTKIYIVFALMVAIPLAIVIKNSVTKYIEKKKDEI